MGSPTAFLFLAGLYLLIATPVIWVTIVRGRRSGRLGPKGGATLLSSWIVGMALVVMFAGLASGEGLGLDWLLSEVVPITIVVVVVWLAGYASPLGAGLTGKYPDFKYPVTKPHPTVQGAPTTRLLRWRLWTSLFVVSTLAVFAVVALIRGHALPWLLVGVLAGASQLVVMVLLWITWRSTLRQRGWHW